MSINDKFKNNSWPERTLKEAVELLKHCTSVQEGADKLEISRRKLERMFAKNKLSSPASYLQGGFLGHKKSKKNVQPSLFKEEKVDTKQQKKVDEVRDYKLANKIETLERDKLKTDVLKWKTWKENIGNEIFKIVGNKASEYVVPTLELTPTKREYAAIFSLQDFHLGRLSSPVEVSDATSIEQQVKLLFDCVKDLISQTVGFGKPQKLYMTIGGDFINSDNSKLTTTNGTPQDSFPSHSGLMLQGGLVLVGLVDLLRQVFPVIEFVPSPGNHDRDTSVSLYMFISAWFRDCPGIVTNFDLQNVKVRQYRKYGENLLAFMHGDGSKLKQWPIVIANEAREIWGQTKHAILVTGHKHFRISQDLFGMQHIQVPSMASEDRWSMLNGYQSQKCISWVLVDANRGYLAELVSHAT